MTVSSGTAKPSPVSTDASSFRLLITRLHFYVGLFIGPFIFVAALSGTLYVLTPQIESWLYREQLQARTTGEARPLADQLDAARAFIGSGPKFFAIRPAPEEGRTTMVMFSQAGLKESESRAIFVDPASLAIQGDLIAYGTSGILPFRTMLDYLHRNLLLGNIGRNYSELAASWLWVAVLGGVALWFWQRRLVRPAKTKQAAAKRLHSLIGLWIGLGLLFLSATGLTWSRFAGDHIDRFRSEVGWVTPSVSLSLGPAPDTAPMGEHAEHQAGAEHGGMVMQMPEPEIFAKADAVLASARAGGIDSGMVEVRPPKAAGQAWTVREYDRQWPTQVDTVAVDPGTMAITSRADFETFPIIAKLIRWGIDAHMGILFGVVNQIVMAGLGISLMAMIAYGYRLWWLRRPAPGSAPRSLIRAWSYLSPRGKTVSVIIAAVFGLLLPLMGVSLIAFVLADLVRWGLSGLMDSGQAKPAR
ncbi:PepSY domain-containing protein [Rhizobium sp. XQZ8]|uniref:PepSY-associated TM helix domain-containing protein n=1 Tax=Rhizobium populisoli TaxID=2859785 RepID=UPI001C66C91E|nr:PepSY-associated TM helix domain-containing protein [Rhizobium populisoli]MBW6421417.1 PepSY domain-containing protein [Rhizobium populisoli]